VAGLLGHAPNLRPTSPTDAVRCSRGRRARRDRGKSAVDTLALPATAL
jgi:hypothetical protein